MVRFLFDSNRKMPLSGDSEFKSLKKSYAQGKELRGKNTRNYRFWSHRRRSCQKSYWIRNES